MIDSYTDDPSISKSPNITFGCEALQGFLLSKKILRKSNNKYIRLMFKDDKLIKITILKILSDSFITDELVSYKVEYVFPLTPYPNHFVKDMVITELIGYPVFMKSPIKVLLFDYDEKLLERLNLNEDDFDNRILYGNKTKIT